MSAREAVSEALLLDAIAAELARPASASTPTSVLLIGMQACATVAAVNQLTGPERVSLLHLDRAAGAVACGAGNREAFLGSGVSGDAADAAGGLAEPDGLQIVGLNVEAAKSYRLLREIVALTAGLVHPDGCVLAAGPKKGGAEVAASRLRELFEQVELVTYRKGHRVYRASRLRAAIAGSAPASAPRSPRSNAVVMLTLRGHELHLVQDDRIFARGQLDPATRMLAEVFEVPPGAAVLDLGCGGGVLGILAARLQPSSQCTLVDSDPLAVEAARRGAALSGTVNVSVHLSDVLEELPGQTYDAIVMNPPFHRGRLHDRALAERFLTEASAALRLGGQLWIVCNRFLPYERLLERLLGPVREVTGDASFKVLLAGRRTRMADDLAR